MVTESARIAIIGGTGALGSGIASRLARAGIPIIIGSREGAKAESAAAALRARFGADLAAVQGDINIEAASKADIVIVAVPFASQRQTLGEIAPFVEGKIVVDTTVPLVPPKVGRVQLPVEGSAAAIAAGVLGPNVTVVSAFHNVSAEKLGRPEQLDCDVLVFGGNVEASGQVVKMVERMGLRGVHAGPLDNSAAAEALTSVLISINKRYGVSGGAGIRIVGLEKNSVVVG